MCLHELLQTPYSKELTGSRKIQRRYDKTSTVIPPMTTTRQKFAFPSPSLVRRSRGITHQLAWRLTSGGPGRPLPRIRLISRQAAHHLVSYNLAALARRALASMTPAASSMPGMSAGGTCSGAADLSSFSSVACAAYDRPDGSAMEGGVAGATATFSDAGEGARMTRSSRRARRASLLPPRRRRFFLERLARYYCS